MSAPQITEEAPGELGSLTLTDIPVMGPTEQWPPRLASVTPIPSPDEAGPIEPVEVPSFTAVPPPVVAALPGPFPEPVTIQPVPLREPQPDFTAAPRPAVSVPASRQDAELYTIQLEPVEQPRSEPTSPSAPVSAQPAPVGTGQSEPAPEPSPLVDPSATWTPFRWEQGYPVIYWASVAIGLVSQIIGWSQIFVVPPAVAMAGAVLVGGICELTMVTASDKGLNWVARNLRAREFVPFLVVSTAAAHIAVYMVYTHWHGTLGLYLAIVSAAGFIGHMLDGGFKAMRQRRRVQAYEAELAVQRERAEAAAEQRRAEAAAAEQRRAEAAEAERRRAEAAAQFDSEPPRATRKNQKVSKRQAVTLGVQQQASTLSGLRSALRDAGFSLPSESSLKSYLAEVKQYLA